MAEFLTTTGVSHRIEQIIDGAKEKLVLVSPYLKVNTRFRGLLEEKDRWKIDIRLIYGKQDLSPTEIDWISKLKSVRTSYCENLHAKCYYNETQAIVTSMNLYEFSEVNNQEIGVAFTQAGDAELFEAMKKEIERILRLSDEISLAVQKVDKEEKKSDAPKPTSKPVAKSTPAVIANQGHCIRCSAPIAQNPEYPYCKSCFSSWNQYKNPEYKEKVCHICGAPNPSTIEKPVCRSCYSKYFR